MTYCHIAPYNDKKAKHEVYLNILFDFYKSFELESKGIKSIYSNEIILHNLVCTVTLMSSNSHATKEYVFQRDPKQNYLVNSGNMLLSYIFKEHEIEELVKWRNGGIVTIKWQFNGSGQVEKDSNTHLVNLTTFYDSNFNFPMINDIQWAEIIKQKGLNDNGIMNLQDDKYSGNDRSKKLNDLLDYTLTIRKSNNSDNYGVWQARIERIIEKTYGGDSVELKQTKMQIN